MTDAQRIIATEAALNFAVVQRNSNAADAINMAGEIAVLKATIAERDAEIADLKKPKEE